MKGMSSESWFVGVSLVTRDAGVVLYEAASTVEVVRVLEACGCKAEALLDNGCASARLPPSWVTALRRDGGLSRRVELEGKSFLVSVELP
jgi:hypothetical protein